MAFRQLRIRVPEWASAIACALVGVKAAAAGPFAPHPIPESERWATITHAGNEPFEYPWGFGPYRVGRVDYEFQIMRTEVTHGEWIEFVQAYAPYVDGDHSGSSEFTSDFITRSGFQQYRLQPGTENLAIRVGWRFAARYANWLHNGRAPHREAFETGVYDTSTFGTNPDGTFTDQRVRSPGATYWIPNDDEWVKSAYFDPNKNGPDQPGYWRYPISSDTVPIKAPPDAGGQTNASAAGEFTELDIASYRTVQSPWGLWDASGGQREWTETPAALDFVPGAAPRWRLTRGSSFYQGNAGWEFADRIDWLNGSAPHIKTGLRVARAVPGAPGAGVFCCTLFLILCRRRPDNEVGSHRVVHDLDSLAGFRSPGSDLPG